MASPSSRWQEYRNPYCQLQDSWVHMLGKNLCTHLYMYAVVHVYLYIWMLEVVTEYLPRLLSICDVYMSRYVLVSVVCTHSCLHAYGHMCGHACMWKPEMDPGCLLWLHSTLFIEAWSLSWTQNLGIDCHAFPYILDIRTPDFTWSTKHSTYWPVLHLVFIETGSLALSRAPRLIRLAGGHGLGMFLGLQTHILMPLFCHGWQGPEIKSPCLSSKRFNGRDVFSAPAGLGCNKIYMNSNSYKYPT